MKELLTIAPVTIWTTFQGGYVLFLSDLDVCSDGSGDSHGDPCYQSETAYWNGGKFLNADVDRYIVIPPQIRSMVGPIVMGCQARVTNLTTGQWFSAVTGEIGPDDKTGEAAICLAQMLNPGVTVGAGDERRIYLYELFPGIPAVVDGKRYDLEPA